MTCSVCDERHNSKLHDQVLEKRAQRSQRGARGGRGRQSSRAKPGSSAEMLETAAKRAKIGGYSAGFLDEVNPAYQDMMRYHEQWYDQALASEVDAYNAVLTRSHDEDNVDDEI